VKEWALALQYASGRLRGNSQIVMEAVKKNGSALNYVSGNLRYDARIVLEAAKQNGDMLHLASESLKDNYDIVLEAVKRTGGALKHASERLKDVPDIVIEAVKKYGNALQYASKRMQDSPCIVLEAVKQNGYALQHASKRLQDDEATVLAAMETTFHAFFYASERLKNNVQFVAQGIQCYSGNIDMGMYRTREFVFTVLWPIFPILQVVDMAADNCTGQMSFVANQGRDAAVKCAEWIKSYHVEKIWLLGQASNHLFTELVVRIDALCDHDLSRGFQLGNRLIYFAPILSALECKGLSWKDLLNDTWVGTSIRDRWKSW
jgi:hypothetical protein